MSLKYKFDKLNENRAQQSETETVPVKNIELYSSLDNVRQLRLVEINGGQKLLNYSYLLSIEFVPDDNLITLHFTTEIIVLKGINLQSLFDDFVSHMPKNILCIDERYIGLENKQEPTVTQITIKSE